MTITEMCHAARALEASENYAGFARLPNSNLRLPDTALLNETQRIKRGEKEFWSKVFNKRIVWNTPVELYNFALSEWVARIPGLFWTPGANTVRKSASRAGREQSERWAALPPLGKSRKVMGGVGTLRFPPDLRDGYRLAGLTSGLNASAGIPVLIAPDVWRHRELCEGKVINRLTARWQSMSATSWAERFPSTRGIPKGFLVVENPDDLSSDPSIVATKFHPCSVMEYLSDDSILYDFVYATADTGKSNYRSYIKEFFADYKNANERYGRYLLAADVEDPLWEAEFETPEALCRADSGAKSQLELLQERIRGSCFNNQNLDEILKLLNKRYEIDDLKCLSFDIGISPSVWYKGSSVAKSSADLLAECVRHKKVEELLDAIILGKNALRTLLADLYPTIEESRMLVRDVEMSAQEIAFNRKAVLNWYEILREAKIKNKVAMIIERARRDFPRNTQLNELRKNLTDG